METIFEGKFHGEPSPLLFGGNEQEKRTEVPFNLATDISNSSQKYWERRLLPEIDSLPPIVARYILDLGNKIENPPGKSAFDIYINIRKDFAIAALKQGLDQNTVFDIEKLPVPTISKSRGYWILRLWLEKKSLAEELENEVGGLMEKWMTDETGLSPGLTSELQLYIVKLQEKVRKNENISNDEKELLNQERAGEKAKIILNKLARIHSEQGIGRHKNKKITKIKQLRDKLRKIDKRRSPFENTADDRRKILYDEKGGSMYVYRPDGGRSILTEGDIKADMLWGIKYTVNPNSFPPKKWRRISKIISLEETRKEVTTLFNKETSRFAISGGSKQKEDFIQQKTEQKFGNLSVGLLAEIIMECLLTRLSLDNDNLSIKIEPTTDMEDAAAKYDLKLIIRRNNQQIIIGDDGIPKKQSPQETKTIGVQLTISQDGSYIMIKKRQVSEAKKSIINSSEYRKITKKPVDDIVIVVLPRLHYKRYLDSWVKAGRPSGGPEAFINKKTRFKILKSILGKVTKISDEELRNFIS